MKSIILSLLVIFCCGCGKMDTMEIPLEPKPQKFGDLQVEVLKCLNPPSCNSTEPIPSVDVFIYNSEEDQSTGMDEARIGSTNVQGLVRFNTLDSFLVYITVTNDSIFNQSFERVPQNSLSLHQVLIR